jgi:hypothetical protein
VQVYTENALAKFLQNLLSIATCFYCTKITRVQIWANIYCAHIWTLLSLSV